VSSASNYWDKSRREWRCEYEKSSVGKVAGGLILVFAAGLLVFGAASANAAATPTGLSGTGTGAGETDLGDLVADAIRAKVRPTLVL